VSMIESQILRRLEAASKIEGRILRTLEATS
jgi:hypothetical protein